MKIFAFWVFFFFLVLNLLWNETFWALLIGFLVSFYRWANWVLETLNNLLWAFNMYRTVEILTQEYLTPRHINILAAVLFYASITLKLNIIKFSLCIILCVSWTNIRNSWNLRTIFELILPRVLNMNTEKNMKYSVSYSRWHLTISLLLMWHFRFFILLSWIKCVQSVCIWSSLFSVTGGRAGAWFLLTLLRLAWPSGNAVRERRQCFLTLVAVIKLYLCVRFQEYFLNPV